PLTCARPQVIPTTGGRDREALPAGVARGRALQCGDVAAVRGDACINVCDDQLDLLRENVGRAVSVTSESRSRLRLRRLVAEAIDLCLGHYVTPTGTIVDCRVAMRTAVLTSRGMDARFVMCVSRVPSLYTTRMTSYGRAPGFGTVLSPTSYGAPSDCRSRFTAAFSACSCVVM